jgi:hypothetical protein
MARDRLDELWGAAFHTASGAKPHTLVAWLYYLQRMGVGSSTAITPPSMSAEVMDAVQRGVLHVGRNANVIDLADEPITAAAILEVGDKRIQDTYLPAGSIVFLTTNLAEEGLGDALLDHSLDRLTVVEVRKSNADEWKPWAAENDIHPAMIAWVDQTPTVLASFRDDDFDQDNPYVYNPKRVQGKIITPRSLELASNVMHEREKITPNALTCALVGTVGNAGANDIMSFLAYQDEIPTRTSIIDTPDTATIPGSVGAIVTLLFNLERAVDSETITPIMKYIGRLEAEHQAVFCTTLARSKSKQKIAFTNKAFTDWARENQDIL